MIKRVKHYIPDENQEMAIGHDEKGFFIFVPEDEHYPIISDKKEIGEKKECRTYRAK